jgi:hypothetical protein
LVTQVDRHPIPNASGYSRNQILLKRQERAAMTDRPSGRLENIQQRECFITATEDWLEELLPVALLPDYVDKVAEKSIRRVIYPAKGVSYPLFRFLLANLLPLLPPSWLDYLVHPVSIARHDPCATPTNSSHLAGSF